MVKEKWDDLQKRVTDVNRAITMLESESIRIQKEFNTNINFSLKSFEDKLSVLKNDNDNALKDEKDKLSFFKSIQQSFENRLLEVRNDSINLLDKFKIDLSNIENEIIRSHNIHLDEIKKSFEVSLDNQVKEFNATIEKEMIFYKNYLVEDIEVHFDEIIDNVVIKHAKRIFLIIVKEFFKKLLFWKKNR